MVVPLSGVARGAAPRVGLVPLDNRPVCLTHVMKLGKPVGLDMAVPPFAAIGAYTFPGEPDRVLDWLEAEAPRLDVLILSLEMATLGGLVPSRTDAFTEAEVMRRLERIEKIARANPRMKIWAFGVLQRIARTGIGKAKEDGITALLADYLITKDEADAKDDKAIAARAERLMKNIPPADLSAYLSARRRNHASNMKTIEMASRGVFDLLVIGMDDNARYGPHRMERDELVAEIGRLGAGANVTIKPGADELAQLLTARAALFFRKKVPEIYVAVSDPRSLEAVMPLEDRKLNDSLDQAISLAGARRAASLKDGDGVLFVHSDDKDTPADAELAASLVKRGGRVSVADVRGINAGSAEFAEALAARVGRLDSLVGYGGWNTPSNAMGTAVAMLLIDGVRARTPAVDEAWETFLFERFVDDVVFMAEVRPVIKAGNFEGGSEGARYGAMRRILVERLRRIAGEFYEKYFAAGSKSAVRIDIQIPWFRLFEIDVNARILSTAK